MPSLTLIVLSACSSGATDAAGGDPSDASPVEDAPPPEETSVDTAPPDPCATAACPAHATCKVVDGAATCPCDKDYLAYKSGCSIDEDDDGLSEDEELDVAKALAPVLVFDKNETLTARRSYFAVAPLADGGRTVFYAHGYFEDGGATFGVTAHVGDSEFVVVSQPKTGEPSLFLSSHYKASTDASVWVPLSKLEKTTTSDGVRRPLVFVAYRKHANYQDVATCEAGAFYTDTCSRGAMQIAEVLADRNVGQSSKPLLDDVVVSSPEARHEYFWSDVRFCGWQVPGDAKADRTKCAPLANAYGRELRAWETGML